MTTVPSNSSVDNAVADEWRRRRRVFRLYLSLLAIPIAAAAYAVVYGVSQQEAVARDVAPRVAQSVTESVATKVETQARSAAKEEVAPSLRRIDEVASKQTKLENDVATVQSQTAMIRELQPQVAQVQQDLGASLRRLEAIAGQQTKIEGELTNVRIAMTQRVPPDDNGTDRRLAAQLAAIRAALDKLDARVTLLEKERRRDVNILKPPG
ncbi:MAG TPA: hypothetical protein VJ276_16875 [Thermoanaerobaculia bacterium]|nr:hypothetical protein [Thermoanaerobaculia bacterium]